MKKVFNKKRHIYQKTAADCALAAMAMFYNIPWETIKDLYSSEILYYKCRIDLDENDPEYFERLFKIAFPSQDNMDDIDSRISGLNALDKYYLNSIVGYSNFVEAPYLVLGIPCLINTLYWLNDRIEGHAMFFDGNFIYDSGIPLSQYELEKPKGVFIYEMKRIPPFGRCTYIFNDDSDIPKHLAQINKLIGHNDPYKIIPFKIIMMKDSKSFDPDNYEIMYESSMENVNEFLQEVEKETWPAMTFEQYLKQYPKLKAPYFNSNMAGEMFAPYEEFKEKSSNFFNNLKKQQEEEALKRKIKKNPETIKVTYLPKEIYIKGYKKKSNPVTSKRTDEKLWEKVKKEAVNKMGGHSARAMQYAVKLYKDRGGKYIGQKRADNDLATWTRAKWQYAPDSKSKDRYLPKEAWKKLSKEEIRATRKKKKGKMGEWVENTEKAKRAAREATKKARRKYE
jgi:hypothetical protein